MRLNKNEIIKKCIYYMEDRRYQKAVETLNNAIKNDPQNPSYYELLALAYEKQEKISDAYESYTMAVFLLEGVGNFFRKLKLRLKKIGLKPRLKKELKKQESSPEESKLYTLWNLIKGVAVILALIPFWVSIVTKKPPEAVQLNNHFFSIYIIAFLLILVECIERVGFGKILSPKIRFYFFHVKVVFLTVFLLVGMSILAKSSIYQTEALGELKTLFLYGIPFFIFEGVIQLIVVWIKKIKKQSFEETEEEMFDRQVNTEMLGDFVVKTTLTSMGVHVNTSDLITTTPLKPKTVEKQPKANYTEEYLSNGTPVFKGNKPLIANTRFDKSYDIWLVAKSISIIIAAIFCFALLLLFTSSPPLKVHFPGIVRWSVYLLMKLSLFLSFTIGVSTLKDIPLFFKYNEWHDVAVRGIPTLIKSETRELVIRYLRKFKSILLLKQILAYGSIGVGIAAVLVAYFHLSGAIIHRFPLLLILFTVYLFAISVLIIIDTYFKLKLARILIEHWTVHQKDRVH